MGKRQFAREDSLFNTEDLNFDLPPSPLVQEQKKRRAKELERQRELVRTKDARAASASELLAEWVQHMKARGLSETDVPTEIKNRVGRTLRSLIKKGYVYDEITYALMTFTVRDLRDRKYTPKTGNLEIYARQYRGENLNEKSANEAEQERLRQEAIAQGQAPTSGTKRQNQRDASLMALAEVERERRERKARQQITSPGAERRALPPSLGGGERRERTTDDQ